MVRTILQVCKKRRSPLRISSYSFQRFAGRDTPVCGWFQSSDWAERTRPPLSRRTKRALMWPGTGERGERTGAEGKKVWEAVLQWCWCCSTVIWLTLKARGLIPHRGTALLHIIDNKTDPSSAACAIKWYAEWSLWKCLDESDEGDHRVVTRSKALINRAAISDLCYGMWLGEGTAVSLTQGSRSCLWRQ